MALFGSRRKQVEALEREVISNPTPQNMKALVERLIQSGDEDRAVEMAKKAVDRFPDSEECTVLYQNVRKVQLQHRIQQLNQALRDKPSVANFEQLANLYFWDLGNRNKAFEIATEGLSKFPNSDGLNLVCGQIRMARFHRDFLSNDFNEAVRHLQDAARTNPNNFKAHMILGRIHAEVGAYKAALESIETALQSDPSNPELQKLKEKVSENMASNVDFVDDALIDVEKNKGLSEVGQQIMDIFEPKHRGTQQLQISPAKIEQFLQSYEAINGYKCSAVLSAEGDLIAAHSRGDVSREQFVGMVQKVLANALDSAKKMDIGAFVAGELETPIGRIMMAAWKNVMLSILADQPAKKEDLEAAKERFVGFAAVQVGPTNA